MSQSAREALLVELLGDAGELIRRFDHARADLIAATSALQAAAAELDRTRDRALLAMASGADAARRSVGDYIVKSTNEACQRAVARIEATSPIRTEPIEATGDSGASGRSEIESCPRRVALPHVAIIVLASAVGSMLGMAVLLIVSRAPL